MSEALDHARYWLVVDGPKADRIENLIDAKIADALDSAPVTRGDGTYTAAQLQTLLDERDNFIVRKGLWAEFVASFDPTPPHGAPAPGDNEPDVDITNAPFPASLEAALEELDAANPDPNVKRARKAEARLAEVERERDEAKAVARKLLETLRDVRAWLGQDPGTDYDELTLLKQIDAALSLATEHEGG
jgi:hypothetical protein